MTRKSKKQLDAEVAVTAEALDGQAAEDVFAEVDDTAELVDPTPSKEPKPGKLKPKPGPIVKKAQPPLVEREPPTEEEIAAAAPKQYLVKRGGRILHRGFLTELRTGKVIRAGGYNIEQIIQQGIELEEVEE